MSGSGSAGSPGAELASAGSPACADRLRRLTASAVAAPSTAAVPKNRNAVAGAFHSGRRVAAYTMTEHGWAADEWPRIYQQVLAADILVLAGPIWLGDNSSVMKQVIERLYSCSHLLNEAGQYVYYGRVGGCLITGDHPAESAG